MRTSDSHKVLNFLFTKIVYARVILGGGASGQFREFPSPQGRTLRQAARTVPLQAQLAERLADQPHRSRGFPFRPPENWKDASGPSRSSMRANPTAR
jgi:hypothetical protein